MALRYNLKESQEFDVHAITRIRVRLLKNLKIFDDEIKLVISCKIAGHDKRKDIYTLYCVLSSVGCKSFMNDFLMQAVGDHFVVRKDSRGKIYSVRGGKKIKQFLFGLPIKNALLWFGTILSVSNGSKEWAYVDKVNKDVKIIYSFCRTNGRSGVKITGNLLNANFFNPFTDFRCSGEAVFNSKKGRIAISQKNLKATLMNIFDFSIDMKSGELKYLQEA